MERRPFGKSGINLPVMGIGCWSYGGGDYWGPQAQKDVDAVVHGALEDGINFFDTAEGYNSGRSEEALGKALKGRRHEALIGTKIGNPDPAAVRERCEASLRRLQTDYVDIYMIHWPFTDYTVDDVFSELKTLKSEGKIRSIAVSNFGVRQLSEALATGTQLDGNQLCYNLLSRAIEVEILPLCMKRGLGTLTYMPLMQGILTGMYRTPDDIPPIHARFRHFRGDRPLAKHGETGVEAEMFEAIDHIRKIAAAHNMPMSQLAIAWVMAKPGVTCVLTGTRVLSELQENVRVTSLNLPPETIAQLDAVTEPVLRKLGANADYFLAKRTY